MAALRRATRRDQPCPGVRVASFEQALECVALDGSVEPLELGSGADPSAGSFGRVAVVVRRSPTRAEEPGARAAESALEIVDDRFRHRRH